uniref:Putative secreted protein n=1 Tax=Anopheles marajoara TaxID=58244 RepID=A0A2M4C8S2_9DIPT
MMMVPRWRVIRAGPVAALRTLLLLLLACSLDDRFALLHPPLCLECLAQSQPNVNAKSGRLVEDVASDATNVANTRSTKTTDQNKETNRKRASRISFFISL